MYEAARRAQMGCCWCSWWQALRVQRGGMCEKVVAGALICARVARVEKWLLNTRVLLPADNLAGRQKGVRIYWMSGREKTPGARPVRLIERVVRGDRDAWLRFVEAYSGFLYSLAWRYARGDADTAAELVVVALEGLKRPGADGRDFYRLRRYLDSLEEYGGRSKFVTWLALVVRNLFRDWFREKKGRRLLPKEIESLETRAQQVFKLVFHEALDERQAFYRLKNEYPDLKEKEFDGLLEEVMGVLSEKNLWSIYNDLLRRVEPLHLDHPLPRGQGQKVELADLKPRSRPDKLMLLAEDKAIGDIVSRELEKAVDALGEVTRNVLLMHAIRGLSGRQVARAMGFRKRQRVYDELAKARHKIGKYMRKAGIDAEQIRRAMGWLDEVLDGEEKKSPAPQNGSGLPS